MKIGLKFKKIPDVVVPNFCTPMFQSTIHATVEITPVYKIDCMKEVFIFDTAKLEKLNGRITKSPNIPEYNVDIMGVVVNIAHLLQTEYIPQTHTAAIIYKSPVLKRNERNRSIFPFESTSITPKSEKNIENICRILILSFKKKNEKIAIEIMFNVDINPTLVAEVFSNATNCNRLNRTTPVIPIKNNGRIALRGGNIFLSFHHTIGKRQLIAMIHLKLVNVIGEACSTSDFPTTKFPPHNKLVKSNNEK